MNQLSLGARAMLARLPRRQTITDREAIIEQITSAGLPVFEPIVAFQVQYGGVAYVIRGSGSGFSFDLFLDYGQNKPRTFEAEQDPHGYWSFYCGAVPSAPVTFHIRQDGAICVDGDDDVLVPVATSVEKYIESDAMWDGLMDIRSKWWEIFFEVAATDRSVDAVLAQGRTVVAVSSDAYTTWWANEQSHVCRRTMFVPEATNRVTAYLPTRDAAARLAATVTPILGETPEVFSYPYDVQEHQASYRREQQRKRNS
jgi:hypothetical protein